MCSLPQIDDYVEFSGAGNSVAGSTFSATAENLVVVPTTATVTAALLSEQPHFSTSHLSSSPSPSASPIRSTHSVLPTSPGLPERPSLAALSARYARPALLARSAITAQPARLVLPARQVHSSVYVDPRPARVSTYTELCTCPATARRNRHLRQHNLIICSMSMIIF